MKVCRSLNDTGKAVFVLLPRQAQCQPKQHIFILSEF
jgi:hypothetical protein